MADLDVKTFLKNNREQYSPTYSKWQNKEEWALAGLIHDRFHQMYRARQDGCYLINYDGAGWDNHWDLLEKDYLAYAEFNNDDDFRSNFKSTMAYRTIAALDAKERRQEVDFLIDERSENDKGRGLVFRYLYDDYFRRHPEIRHKFNDVSLRAKIFGTAIAYIPYTLKTRDVKIRKVSDYDPAEVETDSDDVEVEFEEKTIIDYEDIDFVPINLKDFYVDPNAQRLHGNNFAATDCGWVTYQTREQIRAEFGDEPEVQNLDKLDNISNNHKDFGVKFFTPPRDDERGYIQVLRYYNQRTDSYVVLADNIVIMDTVLPYKDKKLPFVDFRCIPHPNQFYGIGIVDLVLQQSSEDAAQRNLQMEAIKWRTSGVTLVGNGVYGEVSDELSTYEPNKVIPVSDPEQIRPMEFPEVPFDSWRMRRELGEEAAMNTGVNPQGINLPMASTPATNTLTMKESMTDMLNRYSDNMMEGMNEWGRLLYSRFCEFYSKPYKQETLKLNKKVYRTLRLEDISIRESKGTMKTRNIKGTQFLELKPEYFEWKSDPTVYISPDFVTPISQAWQMRKAQEMLPQLAPFAGDPDKPLPDGTAPVIHKRRLIDEFLDKMGWGDHNLLLNDDEDRLEEMEQAAEQHEAMQKGEIVYAHPGEPKAHIYTHAKELQQLNATVAEPRFQQMQQARDPEVAEAAAKILEYRKDLAEHLRRDMISTINSGPAAVKETDAMDQAMQGGTQQPQRPRNNAVNVPSVSGNQGMPNQGGIPVPNKQGVEDITGQMAGSQI